VFDLGRAVDCGKNKENKDESGTKGEMEFHTQGFSFGSIVKELVHT
jgi:hypothetical protein